MESGFWKMVLNPKKKKDSSSQQGHIALLDLCGECLWCLKQRQPSCNPEGTTLRTKLDPQEDHLEHAPRALDVGFEPLPSPSLEISYLQPCCCVKQ